MPKLVLYVKDGQQTPRILEDDNKTFSPTPEGWYYRLHRNFKLSITDSDYLFLEERTPNGVRILLVENPYSGGGNIRVDDNGVVIPQHIVSFAKNENGLITDVQIDTKGVVVASDLHLIIDYYPDSGEHKIPVSKISSDTLAYSAWLNTQAMESYIQEYVRQVQEAQAIQNYNYQQFITFISQDAVRAKHNKHSRRKHTDVALTMRNQQVKEQAPALLESLDSFDKTRASNQKPKPITNSTRPAANDSPSLLFSVDSNAIQMHRHAADYARLEENFDKTFQIALAKAKIESLAAKYGVVLTQEKVHDMLDDIVQVCLQHPELPAQDLTWSAQELIKNCSLSFRNCIELLDYISSLKNIHSSTTLVVDKLVPIFAPIICRELLTQYIPELLSDDLLNYFNGAAGELIFVHSPDDTQAKRTSLFAAVEIKIIQASKDANGVASYDSNSKVNDTNSVAAMPVTNSSSDAAKPDKSKSKRNKKKGKKKGNPPPNTLLKDDDSLDEEFLASLDAEARALQKADPYEEALRLLQDCLDNDAVQTELERHLNENLDICKKTEQGEPTLLMLALAKKIKSTELIELLALNSGAAIAHKDNQGNTVLHYWIENYNPDSHEAYKIFILLNDRLMHHLKEYRFASCLSSASGLNYAPVVDFYKRNTRDTYLHLFINKVKSAKYLMAYLSLIIPKQGSDILLSPASAVLIAKNAENDNLYLLFNDRENQISKTAEDKALLIKIKLMLVCFYNNLAAAYESKQEIIALEAFGPDFLNFFNFNPKNNRDRMRRMTDNPSVNGLIAYYNAIFDKANFLGDPNRCTLKSPKFIKLSSNTSSNKIFYCEPLFNAGVLVALQQQEPSKLSKIIRLWFSVHSGLSERPPIESVVKFILLLMHNSALYDTDDINSAYAVLVQVFTIYSTIQAPGSDIRLHGADYWNEVIYDIFINLSMANDMSDHKIDVDLGLQVLTLALKYFDARQKSIYDGNILHGIFILLNAKQSISDADKRLLTTLKSGLSSKEPGNQLIVFLLKQFDSTARVPTDHINDDGIAREVLMLLAPELENEFEQSRTFRAGINSLRACTLC